MIELTIAISLSIGIIVGAALLALIMEVRE